jgi:hypothetical protein
LRLFVLARHAESVLNYEHRINGDPSVPAPLTEHGREQAALLGLGVRGLPLDVCLHTRFGRTLETAQIALEGRDTPVVEEPLFDDVKIGDLEGQTIDEYHAWKRQHVRSDRFPGGESLVDTAVRYADAYRRLLAAPYACALLVPQRSRRFGRPRRPRPLDPERVAVPLRRERPGEGRGEDRAAGYGNGRNSFVALTCRPGSGPPAIA